MCAWWRVKCINLSSVNTLAKRHGSYHKVWTKLNALTKYYRYPYYKQFYY